MDSKRQRASPASAVTPTAQMSTTADEGAEPARTYLIWRWKVPATPSVQNCSCVTERRLAALGGPSAVCFPVDADHLSENLDHGRKISPKLSLGSMVKSALKDRNW